MFSPLDIRGQKLFADSCPHCRPLEADIITSKTTPSTMHLATVSYDDPVTAESWSRQPESLIRSVRGASTSKGTETFELGKVEAVVNTTALLPCRPLKKAPGSNAWDEGTKGTVSQWHFDFLFIHLADFSRPVIDWRAKPG